MATEASRAVPETGQTVTKVVHMAELCDSANKALASDPPDEPSIPRPVGAGDDVETALLRMCRVMVAATVVTGNELSPSLSATQIRTLTVLAAARGGLSLGAVAESLGATPSAASRICARLVRDGLLDRGSGPGNEIRLTLSLSGRDALFRLNRARLERLVPMLDAVPEPSRPAVLAGLGSLADAIARSRELW